MNTRRGEEQRLLAALVSGASVAEAAAIAGLSQRTVYRRLADTGFQQQLAGMRDELITIALADLVALASQAVAKLGALLEARDERVQLQAARALLEQALRLREAVTLEQRVAELERQNRPQ